MFGYQRCKWFNILSCFNIMSDKRSNGWFKIVIAIDSNIIIIIIVVIIVMIIPLCVVCNQGLFWPNLNINIINDGVSVNTNIYRNNEIWYCSKQMMLHACNGCCSWVWNSDINKVKSQLESNLDFITFAIRWRVSSVANKATTPQSTPTHKNTCKILRSNMLLSMNIILW